MRNILIIVLGLVGLTVHAQDEKYSDVFNKQVSRTPHIIWEWADEDSVRAFQDTVGGMSKFFFKDHEDIDYTYFSYYYNADSVYDGLLVGQMIRDWNSIEMDSSYYHEFLDQHTKYSGDSLRRDVRNFYGVSWNEPYALDSISAVTYEEVSLELDTLSDGEVVFNLFYFRWAEDTVLTNPCDNSLYDKMEMDER
jgi:hypothetical protein|tara:strand:+ start:1390 stop:1971 length:582 start_codon:yes stop_codon:yes gene_type:complete